MTTPALKSRSVNTITLAWLTVVFSLGVFMNVLDTTIANVAIPSIAGDLGVSPYQATWIITAFAASTAIMLPLTGWLARRYGQVRVFVVATLCFTFFSWLCALSINLPMMTLFRVLQGLAAGPMVPLSQSLLLLQYPAEKKGLATAIWGLFALVGPTLGPFVGGFISENWSWPWIFYINIPIGIFCSLSAWYLLATHETPTKKIKIDKMGLVLLIIGVASLQVLLDQGKDLDWFQSDLIVFLGVVALIAISFLIIWELTDAAPIIDLHLFKYRNFTIGTLVLSLGFLMLFGSSVILPLWLQTQMSYTPVFAGLALASTGVLTVFAAPLVGNVMAKIDLRIMTSVGFLIFTWVFFYSSAFNVEVSFNQLVFPRFFQGIAMSLFLVPVVSLLLAGIPDEYIPDAMGLAGFLRILSGSFGTSLSLTLWDRRAVFHHSQLIENVTSTNANSIELVKQIHQLGFSDLASYSQLEKLVLQQAYMLATNDFFWLCGWFSLCLMLVVWLAKPPFVNTPSSQTVE